MTNLQRLQAINKKLEAEWNKKKRNIKLISKLGNEHLKLDAKIKAQKREKSQHETK
jgi:hypothetical protein